MYVSKTETAIDKFIYQSLPFDNNYKIEFIDVVFRLFRAAEEARLPKRLRPELGGALREFTTRESHCFAQIKNSDGTLTLFTSQERQWLVLQVLQGLRAGENDLDALQDSANVEEGQSIGMHKLIIITFDVMN